MFVEIPRWLLVLLTIYLSIPLVVYFIIPYVCYGTKSTKKRIIIFVLGDVGHSPRICYHAISFSRLGWQVELCGYVDDTLPKNISDDPNITVHHISNLNRKGGGTSVLFMVKKVLFQVLSIFKLLWELRGSNYILIQNPPSVPILPIAVLYKLSGCKLIIDWHNLAYSILQLKFKGNFYHPLVLMSYMIEMIFSKFADYNLTVTEAMRKYLIQSFHLNAKRCAVLYDRPASQFQPFPSDISRQKAITTEIFIKDYVHDDFDIEKGDKIIVTSTSFTPDEDIGVLLGALKIYENSYVKFDSSLPRILCFITGKGPLKEEYVKQVKEYNWKRCQVEFVWLSAENYPKLLQLCDYGVSLHTSSSGLDLPMKILDMFGSGLPVIAMNYPVLDELLQHNVNGLKFVDRRELHESLIFAMKDADLYKDLKENVIHETENRWQSNWEGTMKKLKLIH
ncbi:alg1p [Saccharomyces arboricola H-6]|uniref:Chitobiosyldiphosphodolichol beta-mannosyltransferase n=1 Tax=Saccharomyces arboricola (strain H-6 / AS 2.3317 / CBS 10644) TaxID=1160507 RepID=J8LRL2_SACAR|nr:alg1p [Saccharomyces arboricola H-6]